MLLTSGFLEKHSLSEQESHQMLSLYAKATYRLKAYAKWGYDINKKYLNCNRVQIFNSADSNEQIGQLTKNFTTAKLECI